MKIQSTAGGPHLRAARVLLFAGFVNQIDYGVVGYAAVQREADLAGAA